MRQLATLLLLLTCVGCSLLPQPNVLIVTPTPQDSGPTAISTLAPQVQPTDTRAPITLGPAVGADYTIEPTATPRFTAGPPTETVPPRPSTFTPGPSWTPIPTRPTTSPTPDPLAGPPTLTATPIPQLDSSRMGIQLASNMGRVEWDASLTRAKELGVKWIKVQVDWNFLQPNGYDPGEDRLNTFLINIETADQFGFKILFSVAKAPNWARSTNESSGPPNDPQELGNFLTLLLQTKMGPIVDAIEVWNEPNLKIDWVTDQYPFTGAGYMRLFGPAYGAIRGYRSDIIIVTAGLAPTGNSDGTRNDREYLQEMYDAGLGRYQDIVIGVHPYGWANPPDARCCDPSAARGWDDQPQFFFLDTLEDTRAILNRNGHGSVPMWVTEFGWTSWDDLGVGIPDPQADNLWMTENSPIEQANYAIRAFEIGLSRPDVGVMFLWNLNYANPFTLANRDEIAGYSLLVMADDYVQYTKARPLFYMLPQAARSQP